MDVGAEVDAPPVHPALVPATNISLTTSFPHAIAKIPKHFPFNVSIALYARLLGAFVVTLKPDQWPRPLHAFCFAFQAKYAL